MLGIDARESSEKGYEVPLKKIVAALGGRKHVNSLNVLQIDMVFGNSFNVNGLGGVLTSGVLGIGAGLSHSPVVGYLQTLET